MSETQSRAWPTEFKRNKLLLGEILSLSQASISALNWAQKPRGSNCCNINWTPPQSSPRHYIHQNSAVAYELSSIIVVHSEAQISAASLASPERVRVCAIKAVDKKCPFLQLLLAFPDALPCFRPVQKGTIYSKSHKDLLEHFWMSSNIIFTFSGFSLSWLYIPFYNEELFRFHSAIMQHFQMSSWKPALAVCHLCYWPQSSPDQLQWKQRITPVPNNEPIN